MSTQLAKSLLHRTRSSPIPTDPCYDKIEPTAIKISSYHLKGPITHDRGKSSAARPLSAEYKKPKLRSEALVIARHHQGQELAKLFNPSMQIIPIGVRPTQKNVKDHGKENHRKIKEIQRANKEKHIESARPQPMKAVYKPEKFDHVQSKVAHYVKTPLAPRPSTTDGYGRRQRSFSTTQLKKEDCNIVDGKRNERRRPQSAQVQKKAPPTEEKEKRPSLNENATKKERPKSHIKLNKEAVKKSNLKRSPSMTALDDLKKKKEKDLEEHKRGGIPKYLRDRQRHWKKEEEQRIANLPDPTIPEGHTLMEDNQRKLTLSKLKKSHAELLAELKSMPFSRDTLRIKNRKAKLEEKLRDTDSAIKIFSRERVFIKMDS